MTWLRQRGHSDQQQLVLADDHANALQVDHQCLLPDQDGCRVGCGHLERGIVADRWKLIARTPRDKEVRLWGELKGSSARLKSDQQD